MGRNNPGRFVYATAEVVFCLTKILITPSKCGNGLDLFYLDLSVTNTEEQSPDVYTLRFLDDIDNEGRPDEKGAEFSINVSMPCLH